MWFPVASECKGFYEGETQRHELRTDMKGVNVSASIPYHRRVPLVYPLTHSLEQLLVTFVGFIIGALVARAWSYQL